MAFSDFKFTNGCRSIYGGSGRANYKVIAKAYDIAVANGATDDGSMTDNQTDGSRWVPGVALAHNASTLSSNTLPTTTFPATSKCRAWLWSEAPTDGTSTDTNTRQIVGQGTIQLASGSYLDWDAETLEDNGNFVATSQRAFVRLGGDATKGGSSTDGAGSFIGLTAGGHLYTTDQYDGWTDGKTNYWGIGEGSMHTAGYNLILTSTTIGGYQGTAASEGTHNKQFQLSAPELLFFAPGRGNAFLERIYQSTSVQLSTIEKCTGTYAYDTWYHIRLDVIPQAGADLINIYTAPVDGAGSLNDEGVGNETWTLVKQYVMDAGNPSYRRKTTSSGQSFNGHGFIVGAMSNSPTSGTDACTPDDCFLDKYEIHSQDLLS